MGARDDGRRDTTNWASYFLRPAIVSYTRNGDIPGLYGGSHEGKLPVSWIGRPSRTFLLFEEWEYSPLNDGYVVWNQNDFLTQRHRGRGAMTFVDGHAAMMDAIEFNQGTTTWRYYNYFHPW